MYCVLLSLYLNLMCFSGLFFDVICCDLWVCSAVLCAVLLRIMQWDDVRVVSYDFVCTIICDLLSAMIYY